MDAGLHHLIDAAASHGFCFATTGTQRWRRSRRKSETQTPGSETEEEEKGLIKPPSSVQIPLTNAVSIIFLSLVDQQLLEQSSVHSAQGERGEVFTEGSAEKSAEPVIVSTRSPRGWCFHYESNGAKQRYLLCLHTEPRTVLMLKNSSKLMLLSLILYIMSALVVHIHSVWWSPNFLILVAVVEKTPRNVWKNVWLSLNFDKGWQCSVSSGLRTWVQLRLAALRQQRDPAAEGEAESSQSKTASPLVRGRLQLDLFLTSYLSS